MMIASRMWSVHDRENEKDGHLQNVHTFSGLVYGFRLPTTANYSTVNRLLDVLNISRLSEGILYT